MSDESEYCLKVYVDDDPQFVTRMGGTLEETQIAMAGATIAFDVMGYAIYRITEVDGVYRGIKLVHPLGSIRMEIDENEDDWDDL